MTNILVATRNRGKLRELQQIFAGLALTLLTLDDVGITTEIAETGTTYAENARLKAEGYLQLSGLPTIADDSGLEVAALKGAPGVYSARYGDVTGEAQNAYLLKQLEGFPFHERLARFVCVLALARPGGATVFVEGTWYGAIELAPRGTGGHGYDPIFYVVDADKTAAELTPTEKNALSHRGIAGREAREVLAQWLEKGLL